jgi:hypothetical protein|tara:strand:- start:9950 stop:11335 length:1386 start_codon:yes stop_codon:yes gene_type:complete
MAYTINRTDGTAIATITDGTSDNSTSVTLFGKSFSGFGEGLNENLVKLLENSASTSAPSSPLRGELWFDTSTSQLKVYDGSSFKPTGGAKSQNSAPTSPGAGDLWHDSDNDQLYVYTGSAFQLVGPVYTAGQTLSGWLIETLASSGGNKVVSSMYAGNTRVAILSKETFTPSATQTGFATIKAGFTLNSTLGAVFDGTNTQASAIDVSGTSNTSATVIAGGNFLRADAADTTTGALTIDTDSGILIGGSQELTITVSSNDVTIAQTTQDKDMKFTVNDGGVTKTPLTLTGADGGIDMTGDLTITGNLTISGEFEKSGSNINVVDDAFLKLNTGNSEVDSGLIIETSDSDDARLFYDVSENHFVAGEGGSYSQIIRAADTTDDGASNHSTTLKSSSAGGLTLDSLTLNSVGSISEGDTSNKTVATIGAIVTFGDLWGGSAKTVSTSDPSGGNDGDFWFKYTT